MADVLPVYEIVRNRAAVNRRRKGGLEPVSGWLVVALFAKTRSGDPVCVDYRVRAIPDAHKMEQWWAAKDQLIRSMSGDHTALPEMTPSPGGVPRYVFEEASQQRLLAGARKQMGKPTRTEQGRLRREAKAFLASSDRKPGRPPQRSLTDKLRTLQAVEEGYASGRSLEDVARDRAMSRSSLRDLLSWARNDASPRLFTPTRQGRSGGTLTPEGRALLTEIEGSE